MCPLAKTHLNWVAFKHVGCQLRKILSECQSKEGYKPMCLINVRKKMYAIVSLFSVTESVFNSSCYIKRAN